MLIFTRNLHCIQIDITRKINFLFLNGVPFDLETITC